MAESSGEKAPSFATILAAQGADPESGPEDFWIQESRPNELIGSKTYGWYAIPRQIIVTNPLTLERETGRLEENGAFIADTATVNSSSYESRAMILGDSEVTWSELGYAVIVNSAEIKRASIASDTIIDSGSKVVAFDASEHIRIGSGVSIGKAAYITHGSVIEAMSDLGDGVLLTQATLKHGAIVQASDRSDEVLPHDDFRGHCTFIGRSTIGAGTTIETNAQIEGSTIGAESRIGKRAMIEYASLPRETTIDQDALLLFQKPGQTFGGQLPAGANLSPPSRKSRRLFRHPVA